MKLKEKNHQSRRTFMIRMLQAGIAVNIPLLEACKDNHDLKTSIVHQEILNYVLNFIWPQDGNGPSVSDLNIDKYILFEINDKGYDPQKSKYLTDGLQWIEDTSLANYNKKFKQLNKNQKDLLLFSILDSDWGFDWMSQMVTTIFEAVLSDPIYMYNKNGISFHWLNHIPGSPAATETNKYPEILDRKQENIIIKNLNDLK